MRQCPRCTFPLSEYRQQHIELDHCKRCAGTFLDPGEAAWMLAKEAEPAAWKESYASQHKGVSKLGCPAGHGAMDAYEIAYEGEQVEVDACKECGGMWLDANEGKHLRDIASFAEGVKRRKLKGLDRPGFGAYFFQLVTMFPIEVWNPVRRKPIVTLTLLWLNIGLFVLQLILMGTMGVEWFVDYFLEVPAKVVSGQRIWTLITAGFFHADPVHLLGNMYFLYVFGDNVEDALGRKRFILLYALSLFAGSLGHTLASLSSTIPSLGASGAISGLMGAYLVLFPKTKVWLVIFFVRFRLAVIWYLGIWAFWQAISGLSNQFFPDEGRIEGGGVAWFAHLGGFVAGAAWAMVLAKRSLKEILDEKSEHQGGF